MAVSQYTDTISTDVKMSKEEILLWLQSQRDIGMFIECCRKTCKKWRYCDDFHDPVDVPKLWYCKMNSGTCLLLNYEYIDTYRVFHFNFAIEMTKKHSTKKELETKLLSFWEQYLMN